MIGTIRQIFTLVDSSLTSSYYYVTDPVPNWMQPGYYTTTILSGYSTNFNAWCSPTSAANQLGHLVDSGQLSLPPLINDGHKAGISAPTGNYQYNQLVSTSTILWD